MADIKGAIQEVETRKARIQRGFKEVRELLTEVQVTMAERDKVTRQLVTEGFDQLLTMVDSHYAIAGTAALDNSLRAALLTKMRPLSRHMRDRLFEGYGPLATVAAKIDLAFAMEIIPKEIYDQLIKINKIRVVCAHSPEITTFSHPKIIPLLDALELDPSMTDIRSHFMGKLKQIDAQLRSVTAPEHIVD